MYAYNADIYCDTCGEEIARNCRAIDIEDTGDSDQFPQSALPGETDSPTHCAGNAACMDPIDLRPYGARENALVGAESTRIGALVEDDLTEYGVDYLREMLDESPRTPYQVALHTFWREAFADYLP